MVKIGVVQMTSGTGVDENARCVAEAAAQAAAQGAVMLFAPEMAALIDRDRGRAAASITRFEDSRYRSAVCAAASANGIWIHAGSLPVTDEGDPARNRNRSFVVDSSGEVRAVYDKIHLFDIDLPTGERWRESAAYSAGDRAVAVDTPVGRVGLTICYDLRFPRLFEALRDAGADVIVVPAAFTVPTGEAHWHNLLRTRAVDYGCYIIAAAQTGMHADGRLTYGHSLVIDPWGTVIADMGSEPGLAIVDINPAQICDIRQRLPVASHQRPIPPAEIY